MVRELTVLSRLTGLRKLAFGGPLSRSVSSPRQTFTHLFSAIPSLEAISVGSELWDRGKEDKVTLIEQPDEWKDIRWRS